MIVQMRLKFNSEEEADEIIKVSNFHSVYKIGHLFTETVFDSEMNIIKKSEKKDDFYYINVLTSNYDDFIQYESLDERHIHSFAGYKWRDDL